MDNTPIPELKKLYEDFQKKALCPFGHNEQNHYVFGTGNSRARLLLIGEAPGSEEDRLKKPFVGKSGQLLNKIFNQFEIKRDDLFITNVVKCRPPNNRTPEAHEISNEITQLLLQEISIIAPQIICTLGSTATFFFLEKTQTISKLRGIFYKGIHPYTKKQLLLLPTFHPSYALRSRDAETLLAADISKAFNRALL